jgi:lysozyme
LKKQNTKSLMRTMIEDDLIRHEGYVERIYLCSEGYKTFGVGHMVRSDELEYSWPVDTPVSNVRCMQAFSEDLDTALNDAYMLVEDLDEHPLNVQRVIVNMAFNLGYSRLKGFKRMLAAVSNRDYARAAKEMEDSKWYGQVGRRSKELCRLMEWASDDSE